MPTNYAQHAFGEGSAVGLQLYSITVTNPWYGDSGGNISRAPTPQVGFLSGIVAAKGKPSGETVTKMDPGHWTTTGRAVLALDQGVCTDCAAAAAFAYTRRESHQRVEIISIGTHAFVIVGRASGSAIGDPANWGTDAFLIDIWFANQFPPGRYAPIAWLSDHRHPIVQMIHAAANKLRVEGQLQAERDHGTVFSVPQGVSQAQHLRNECGDQGAAAG